MSLFSHYQSRFDQSRPEEYTLEQYLNYVNLILRPTPLPPNAYCLPLVNPKVVDTSKDARLSRMFSNKMIRRYPAFTSFMAWRMRLSKSLLTSAMRLKV